jgi:hypothetical protein
MSTWQVKQGATWPKLEAVLLDASGAVVNLTTATSVTFRMRKQGAAALKVEAAMVVENAAAGAVSYTWDTADTDTVGEYDVDIAVLWANGKIQKWPNPGYDLVSIAPALG